MAFPQIAAFARSANGNLAPTRRIAGQETRISRAAHDIVYDPDNDEILVANPFAQAILVFRGGANGDEPPLRILQGPKTQMMHPDYGIAVDPMHNELWVSEKEQLSVFSRTANGDVAPLRMLKGPDTRLVDARGFVVDPIHNLIVVGAKDGLLIFNRTDTGNVKPRAIIGGPKTGIRSTIQNLRINPAKGLLIAAVGGRGEEDEEGGGASGGGADQDRATGSRGGQERQIAVWSIYDSGDVPPLYVLRNPQGRIPGQRIALNPKEKELFIGGGTRGIEVYSFPEIF